MPTNRNAYWATWKAANPKKVKAASIKWRAANPEKVKAVKAAWRAANPEKVKAVKAAWDRANSENRKAYRHRRLRENPMVRALENLRSRVNQALRGKLKSSRTLQLLGCEIPELKSWLGGWFSEGMTWENYGSVWHVDHNRPCASFDLTKAEEQRRCFSYLNLRPLFAKDNISKGAKYHVQITPVQA